MLNTREVTHDFLSSRCPIEDYPNMSRLSLQFVPPDEFSMRDEGDAIFRLVHWKDFGVRTVTNIVEQSVHLFGSDPIDPADVPRLEACLEAWAGVVTEVLRKNPPDLMPADLTRGKSPMLLKTRKTRQDFDEAWRAKSRLGKWLR